MKQGGEGMKGVVFTEFLEMVEEQFSADMVDDIVEEANVPSKGAYTSVGTYDHREMVALVATLARRSGTPTTELKRGFGSHLFHRFVRSYPSFFTGVHDAFQFLAGIEEIIHAEVRKLYPDAELPRFDVELHDEKNLVLCYSSSRHFEDMAEGLILGCIEHFGEAIELRRETVGAGDSRKERFSLRRA
jgi:hypothetical protein